MKAHRILTAKERDVLHREIKKEIKKQNIGYIDKVQSSYGNRMYSLSNDPRLYIDKIIEIQKNEIARQKQRIISQKEKLQKWEALKEREK